MRKQGFRHIDRNTRKTRLINNGVFSIANAVPGRRYRIIGIDGGYGLNSRLCAIGFIPGEISYVSGVSSRGHLRVVVKGSKFAIGRGMAERIQISEI